MPWNNLSDSNGMYAGIANQYGVLGVPSYFLISPEGIIVDKWVGYKTEMFQSNLEKHIPGLK